MYCLSPCYSTYLSGNTCVCVCACQCKYMCDCQYMFAASVCVGKILYGAKLDSGTCGKSQFTSPARVDIERDARRAQTCYVKCIHIGDRELNLRTSRREIFRFQTSRKYLNRISLFFYFFSLPSVIILRTRKTSILYILNNIIHSTVYSLAGLCEQWRDYDFVMERGDIDFEELTRSCIVYTNTRFFWGGEGLLGQGSDFDFPTEAY